MESAHFHKHGVLPNLSEQQLVDCDTLANSGCNGGWYDTAWQYLKKGSNSQDDYPYHAVDQRCQEINNLFVSTVSDCNGGPNYVCQNPGKSGDEDELTAALNDFPQSVAVDASTFQFYNGGVFYSSSCSSSRLNHAVYAVGYGTEGGQDYYIVKNSWGKAWGESGYIKMSRNRNNNCGIANYPGYAIAA